MNVFDTYNPDWPDELKEAQRRARHFDLRVKALENMSLKIDPRTPEFDELLRRIDEARVQLYYVDMLAHELLYQYDTVDQEQKQRKRNEQNAERHLYFL